MLTFEDRLARLTPVTCRILARRVTATGKVVALTDEEIAAGSGLPVPEVARLSRLLSWRGSKADPFVMLSYMRGCGVDISSRENIKNHSAMMRRTKNIPRYLRTAPHWENQLKPLLLLSLKSHGQN